LTNLLFTVGLTDWVASAATHRPWAFAVSNPKIVALCFATLLLQCLRVGIRIVCVERIFGLVFALGVPLRSFHANLVNCLASFGAMWHYANARLRGRPLVWLKTEHAYPSRDALLLHRRELADVLVSSGYISEDMRLRIQREIPPDTDLADFLLTNSIISDDDLCKAMSVQFGVPSARVDPRRVKPRVVRSLPAHVEERFSIVPFGLQDGRLFVAGPRVPPSSVYGELKSFTRLHVEFQLVTQRNYEELRQLL
jgi:adsorption protein B